MSIDAAMIFAAGFGTRMGVLTRDRPKPMLPLGGQPMIDHAIDLLREAGISRLVANTHYLPETLEAHLAERGVTTLRESPILDTGGGLKAAMSVLGNDPVITMNPDALWLGPNPVEALLAAWKPSMNGLLVLTEAETEASDFSLEHGQIQRKGRYRYTGLQVIRTDRLGEIPDTVFSLNRYWDHILSAAPLHGLVYDGAWMDIGTQAKLEAANRRITR